MKNARRLLVAMSVLALACSSGNKGNPDSGLPGSGSPDAGPTGRLTVNIADPDAGTPPSVTVTGPSFDQTVSETTTFALDPGVYSVVAALLETPDPIVSQEFTPLVTGSPATVTANGTQVSVGYSRRPQTGQLWVSDCGNTGHTYGIAASHLLPDAGYRLPDGGTFVAATDVSFPVTDCVEGIAFDRNHRMWVGSWDSAVWGVDRYVDGGAQTVAALISDGGALASLAFAPNGDLWTTDWNNDALYRWTAAQVAQAVDSGVTPQPFVVPTVSTDAGFASLSEPNTIAFDSHGDLWVSNQGASNLVRYTFLADGGFPLYIDGGVDPYPTGAIVDNGSSMIVKPYAVAFDHEGRLWLSDQMAKAVYRVEPSSVGWVTPIAPLTVFKNLDGGAPYLGTSLGPSGLLFDNSGNLWVNGYFTQILAQIANPTSYTGTVQPPAVVQVTGGPQADIAQMAFDPTPPGLPINH
jgi:streptogramin lyase